MEPQACGGGAGAEAAVPTPKWPDPGIWWLAGASMWCAAALELGECANEGETERPNVPEGPAGDPGACLGDAAG